MSIHHHESHTNALSLRATNGSVPARRSSCLRRSGFAQADVSARRRGNPGSDIRDRGACSEQSAESPGLLRLCLVVSLLAMTLHL